ncbi:MAG: class I SAM-dependent methyltransferase [Candidatus Aenigmatarchaeota archaeon]
MPILKCRACGGSNLETFLNLGPTPLANKFIQEDDLNSPETYFPLDVRFCKDCNLVQLGYVVPPQELFSEYIYFSSTSTDFRIHCGKLAKEISEEILGGKGFVVEIASNDGVLLKQFEKYSGIQTLGIEPAKNIAKIAIASGIDTLPVFFNEETAQEVVKTRGKADVIVGMNVLAHIDDWDDLMRGLNTLLKDDGVAIFESPYLVDLLDKTEFDTIYHEHLSYIAIRPLMVLFKRHGFVLTDAKRTEIHGGSIRLYIRKIVCNQKVSERVHQLAKLEETMGLNSIETYRKFAQNVFNLRIELLNLLRELKQAGKTLVGYGAAAKGNTLLNFIGIRSDVLDYIVDKSPHKQGLYTPGSRIKVLPPERILEDRPDYVLILAWNFANEIIEQQSEYRKRGGKFIVPIPKPKII